MKVSTPTLALLLCAVALGACRDEQAGPRRRPGARPPPPAAAPDPAVLESPPRDLTFRGTATWSQGAIRYLGSTLDPARPKPGDRVTLRHYFVAHRPPPSGWAFFAHLVDPGSGTMMANVDHPFGHGALPLERWPVGKVVVDEHQVQVPQAPSRIVMGFWQGDRRLPVDDPAAHDGQHRALGPPLSGSAGPALPEYRAKKTSAPPTVDGDLGDPAWQEAEAVTLRGSFDGREVPLRTTARILYDDEALYVAFDAEDPDVWGTLMKRDDPIYSQEVVEIFLDADANQRTYNELQVSPNNVQFDAYFPAPRQGMDLGWDSKMKTAVKVEGTLNDDQRDRRWTAELRVPFATLADVPHLPPRSGDRWRFNLYRLELPDRKRQAGQSFAPLFVGDFHAVHRFGWLVFD